MYKFIDISRWEPNIHWDELRSTGIDTVIIKASQGIAKDKEFTRLWREAKSAGFYRGSYHFYDGRFSSNTPKKQAEFYYACHEGDLGELPLWADIEGEYAYGKSYPYCGWANWYDFLEYLKQLVGNKEIGIYTSWGSFESNSPTLQSQRDYFARYPLWVANYKATTPLLPTIWKNVGWTMWQYAETEQIAGVYDYLYDNSGNIIPGSTKLTSVDTNWFNGTKEEFIERFNLDGAVQPPIDPPPPDPNPAHKCGIVAVSALNVRTLPNLSGTIVGQKTQGQEVAFYPAGNADGYSWGKLTNPEYLDKYCAIQNLGSGEYLVATGIPEQEEARIVLSDKSIFYKAHRFGTWVNVLIVNHANKRFQVSKYTGTLKTVSEIAKETGADFVVNGGDFNSYGAFGLAVSDGEIFGEQHDWEPFVNFTKENIPEINRAHKAPYAFNALAGKRMIVENGEISPDTSDSWAFKHPRTIAGISHTGKLILMVADGRQYLEDGSYTDGLDLYDSARVMIEFGTKFAIDLDGGGSSAMWVEELGGIKNVPIENLVLGKERKVADHILVFRENSGSTPDTGGNTTMAFRIKSGAKAYNTYGGYTWGDVPNNLIGISVTIGNKNSGYTQIISPVWPKNLKPFWVKDAYVEEYTVTPADPPVIEPPVTGDWPAYFYLEKPDGTKAKYNKEG